MSQSVTANSYTVRTESGDWLAQVVITSDGMFSAVSHYGNYAFAWRNTGEKDFRRFLMRIQEDYFASKMVLSHPAFSSKEKFRRACCLFAEIILPPFQKLLNEELEIERANELHIAINNTVTVYKEQTP